MGRSCPGNGFFGPEAPSEGVLSSDGAPVFGAFRGRVKARKTRARCKVGGGSAVLYAGKKPQPRRGAAVRPCGRLSLGGSAFLFPGGARCSRPGGGGHSRRFPLPPCAGADP